jgi:predicted Zn-dependent peptidase
MPGDELDSGRNFSSVEAKQSLHSKPHNYQGFEADLKAQQLRYHHLITKQQAWQSRLKALVVIAISLLIAGIFIQRRYFKLLLKKRLLIAEKLKSEALKYRHQLNEGMTLSREANGFVLDRIGAIQDQLTDQKKTLPESSAELVSGLEQLINYLYLLVGQVRFNQQLVNYED